MRDGTYLRSIYAVLLCQGYRIVSPDLRGFGSSTGEVASYGVLDKGDIRQLVDDLQRRGLSRKSFLIVGHSYGASVALQTASEDSRFGLAIALSGQRNLLSIGPAVRAVAARDEPLASLVFGGRITDEMVRAAIVSAAHRYGFDPATSDTVEAARRLKIPYLVAQGREDTSVPVADAEAIGAINPRFATLWIDQDGDHWSYINTPAFLAYLFDWLSSHAPSKDRPNKPTN